jgi:hypothetical protein
MAAGGKNPAPTRRLFGIMINNFLVFNAVGRAALSGGEDIPP